MLITFKSTSAAKSPKPSRPGAANLKGIPESILYLAEKGKFRIKSAQPGHYILTSAQAKAKMVALVRLKEETRFTPSMNTKAFTAQANQEMPIGLEEYTEAEAFLEAEAARAPGAKNAAAGQKMGKKTRAPNMLAPGWWIFIRDSTNKVTKEYVGPRLSARRLVGIFETPVKPNIAGTKVVLPKLGARALASLKAATPDMIKTFEKAAISMKGIHWQDARAAELLVTKVLGKNYKMSKETPRLMLALFKEHGLLR